MTRQQIQGTGEGCHTELPVVAFWLDSRCQIAPWETNSNRELDRCAWCMYRIIAWPKRRVEEDDRLSLQLGATAMEPAAMCARTGATGWEPRALSLQPPCSAQAAACWNCSRGRAWVFSATDTRGRAKGKGAKGEAWSGRGLGQDPHPHLGTPRVRTCTRLLRSSLPFRTHGDHLRLPSRIPAPLPSRLSLLSLLASCLLPSPSPGCSGQQQPQQPRRWAESARGAAALEPPISPPPVSFAPATALAAWLSPDSSSASRTAPPPPQALVPPALRYPLAPCMALSLVGMESVSTKESRVLGTGLSSHRTFLDARGTPTTCWVFSTGCPAGLRGGFNSTSREPEPFLFQR